MISDTHRFIFIHINKAGGTSIEKVFDPDADKADVQHKHRRAKIYQARYPEKFRDYFKFSFVRNPWDWLVSRYHWSRDHQHVVDYSFREFILRLKSRATLSTAAPWMERVLEPQVERLMIDGKMAMDFVGRFERLQPDFDHVCSVLSIPPVMLPHVFKTDHRIYTEYYDEETRRIVGELYRADIEAFGYAFVDASVERR